ncbi:MAG TPA: zinc-ribbon domain-containing protein [Dissulfurispiraceae bacterium]|nr:zinc-ribbon domain-containing protein [Dissulfurispiraceae bacterium]
MRFCAACGKEIGEQSNFCPHCGHSIEGFTNQSNADSPKQHQVSDDDFKIFIWKNSDYYLQRFRKFNIEGTDVFSFTWNWSAFCGGFGWMLYRKLYMWAIIAFVLSLIPHITLIAWIATGAISNYLYYRHAKSKILEIKALHSATDIAGDLRQVGGINRWVPVTAVIITLVFCIAFIIMAFFLMIPFNILDTFNTPSKYI